VTAEHAVIKHTKQSGANIGLSDNGNESSPGTKGPRNESSQELSFSGNESSQERKGPGTKVPGNFRSWGMKVLHRDLSFLGTKGLGYEKSVIRQRQSQLQLRPIAVTIASCKHRVRGLKKTSDRNFASVLCLSSKTILCPYASCTCVIILCL